MFGVLDSVGPQVFFAESRDRAVAEVARANEIVERFPNTISMRHLREMDAAWRAARGLPALPEPEGRRIVVPASGAGRRHLEPGLGGGDQPGRYPPAAGQGGASVRTNAPEPPMPSPPPSVAAVLDMAAEVAARGTMRRRVESAQADLRRTLQLAKELPHAAATADAPLVRFRAALHGLYGEHGPAAEESFRRLVLEQGAQGAATRLRDDPRSLLPLPRPRILAGGTSARVHAAQQAAACAPLLERLDRTLIAACEHVGVVPPQELVNAAEHRRTVIDRLLELAPAQRAIVGEALADYRRAAGTLASSRRLREAWAALAPPQRDVVRAAVPDLDRLLDPPNPPALRRSGAGPAL